MQSFNKFSLQLLFRWNHLKGREFEHNFGPGGWEFERANLQAQGVARGVDVEVSNCRMSSQRTPCTEFAYGESQNKLPKRSMWE